MILVDSSIWIDHLRSSNEALEVLLGNREALGHPFVVGEVALGLLRNRSAVLTAIQDLPQAKVAGADEALAFIDRYKLAGRGIGYIDAHLLAATRLTPDASIWSRDRRLMAVARDLGIAAEIG
jgi:predicted nucleic acid-binding protein